MWRWLFFWILVSTSAWAHGDADWINQMGLGCCGAFDCHQEPDGIWKAEGSGYRNQFTAEFVSEAEAKASIDEHYWICRYHSGGRIRDVTAQEGGKCFFRPAIGF